MHLFIFYVNNEILAGYLILQDTEHLQCFSDLVDILMFRDIPEIAGSSVLILSQNLFSDCFLWNSLATQTEVL